MSLLDFITVVIANLFRVSIIRRFLILFFPEKKSYKKIELIAYILFYILTLLAFCVFHSRYLNIVVNIMGMFALSFLYEGGIRKRIITSVMIYIILMVCDIVSYFLLIRNDGIVPSNQIFQIISDLLVLVCELIAAKIFGGRVPKEYVSTFWILLVIPIISIFMLNNFYSYEMHRRRLMLFESTGMLIINMVVFYLYHMILEVTRQQREKEMMQVQLKVYSNQLDIISQTQKKIRILRHDMVHHIKELSSMVIRNRKEDVIEYLIKMEKSLVNPKERVGSGNHDIDGILNYMLEKADRVLNNVEVEIKIPENMQTYTFELSIIIGNILENAIEAARNSNKKSLSFKMNSEKGLLFIEVCNSYCGIITKHKNRIITTKKDLDNHGLGLESVNEIVGKYNGVMDIDYDQDSFNVKIILYVSILNS